MHPLLSIGLVLFTALLWSVFTVLMLSKVNGADRRAALKRAKKANRMRTGHSRHAGVPGTPGVTRRHRSKVSGRPPSPR
jgi:hypothetical protein